MAWLPHAGHVATNGGAQSALYFSQRQDRARQDHRVDEDADTGLIADHRSRPMATCGSGELTNARLGDWTLAMG